jgi:hypothetical protein
MDPICWICACNRFTFTEKTLLQEQTLEEENGNAYWVSFLPQYVFLTMIKKKRQHVELSEQKCSLLPTHPILSPRLLQQS